MASTSQGNIRQTIPRWEPKESQLRILEDAYRINGGRPPTTTQIIFLTAQLQQYGPLEERNVFFWFQNRKRRERAIPAPIFTSPIFNIAPRAVTARAMDSTTVGPIISNAATTTTIVKVQTFITTTDYGSSSTVVNIVDAQGRYGLDQHFRQVCDAMDRICCRELFGSLDHPTNDDPPPQDEKTLPLFPVYPGDPAGTQFNNNINIGAPIDVDVDLEFRLGPPRI